MRQTIRIVLGIEEAKALADFLLLDKKCQSLQANEVKLASLAFCGQTITQIRRLEDEQADDK